MRSLARWCFRRKFVVLAVWVVSLLVLGGLSASAGTGYTDSFSLPGTESTTALNLLTDNFKTESTDTAPDLVILESAKDVVRLCHVDADVIRLRHRHVVHEVPVPAVVVGNEEAAVGAREQPLRIGRIDPERVMVAEHPASARTECAAAVGRDVEGARKRVDAVRIHRVAAHLRVVEGPVVDPPFVVHDRPRLAAVV